MPKQVTDVDILRDYLKGVVERADHHANNVNEVALAIAGAVVWKKDNAPLEVRERGGELKNVLWFSVNGKRYALSYNHKSGEIELRKESTHGETIASFSNSTPISTIRSIFSAL